MLMVLLLMLCLLLLLNVKLAEATSDLKRGMDTALQAETVSGKSTALLKLVFELVVTMNDGMMIILHPCNVAVMNVFSSQEFELVGA